MDSFCLFIGPGRSGHSLISAILNAHPNVYISNEIGIFRKNGLYNGQKDNIEKRIIKESNRNTIIRGKYRYDIKKSWKNGKPIVVGDKHANNTSMNLSRNFSRLLKFEENIKTPIKWIHSIRNPFDQIATEHMRKKKSIDNLIETYDVIMKVVIRIKNNYPIYEVRNDNIIHNKEKEIINLCKFLGVNPFDSYVKACSDIIYDNPNKSRFSIKWKSEQKNKVNKIIKKYGFLKGYKFNEI